MRASAAASMSSSTAGRMRAAVTAADAAAAASTPGNAAATVTTSPGTIGRRRTVASTMTPSVPSEPVRRAVRSYPVTPFTVRWPVRSRRPSASTTARPSTASRVTPYFAQRRPPAFVAMLPPIVEMARLAGSGANQRPRGASASLRSPLSTPGSTTASSSASETSRMRFIRETSSTIAPGLAIAPPARPVPAPRGTTGVCVSWARRSTACTSSTDAACTTASGRLALRHPERSSRLSSRAAGSVATDAPRASWRRSSTSWGIPPR